MKKISKREKIKKMVEKSGIRQERENCPFIMRFNGGGAIPSCNIVVNSL